MNLETIKSKPLGMILQFSIPAIIAMVLTSLITVVDGFFIGNYVGSAGIAAVNLGLPIIYLYLAVGLMISVGGIAIAGISLGQGDHEKCKQVFNQTISTAVMASGMLSIIMFFCLTPMLQVLHADKDVAGYFQEYYRIMLLQLPVMVINNSFGMFIRGEGNPHYFMKVNLLNVVTNIILDYVFVRFFHMGTTGIAVASLIAGVVTLLCILHYFFKKSKVYRFSRFAFSKDVLKHTVLNGGSEFIGEMSLCIAMFAYNLVIMKHIGTTGVTAFAIVGYISYVFSMVVVGFGQGIVPLTGFSYGAKDYRLARKLRNITNKIIFSVGAILFLIVLLVSRWYSNLFVENDVISQMIDTGVKIFAVSFLFSGINTITSFYYTSLGKAMESAVISSARGLIILLICIFTLPPLLGMTGVWLAAPVTEGVTVGISLFFMYRERKTFILS